MPLFGRRKDGGLGVQAAAIPQHDTDVNFQRFIVHRSALCGQGGYRTLLCSYQPLIFPF